MDLWDVLRFPRRESLVRRRLSGRVSVSRNATSAVVSAGLKFFP